MQPNKASEAIALIDACEHCEEVGRVLAKAGYDVRFVADGEPADGSSIVVRVTSERPQPAIPSPAWRPPATQDEERSHAARSERQKMEAIARLAGGIAHDFNNLLAVISICADEVLDALEPDASARACLEDIRHAVERGSAVTRDLLAFSQTDIRAPRLVDFNDIVTTSQRMVERMVGEDIRIDTTLTAREPFVRIDPTQWSSVFSNLALNARAAMPKGGTLTLVTREVTIDPRERGHDKASGTFVELEVTDTGCGMTEDVRTRAFEPFFTTKEASASAGLGLSVVFGVVEQSGGFIEATSEVGRGTTFRLYVPVAEAVPVTETRRRRVLAPDQTATVLVVEDEAAVRRIAVRALERSGYRVFQAASGEEALASLSEIGSIDLLVTDVVLPGIDGRRLAEKLTADLPNLAVLYTSGYTADEVLRFGVERSELFFLPKPYSTSVLVERASEVLATRASRVEPA